MQLEREDTILRNGAGFEVVERLLGLNDPRTAPYVDVILLSQNSADLSLRAFKFIDYDCLAVKTGFSLVGGRSRLLLRPGALTLERRRKRKRSCCRWRGRCAALHTPRDPAKTPAGEVRVAFDGDAVVFGPESDAICKEKGLDAFLAHDIASAGNPLARGPFGSFLHKLSELRWVFLDEET